LSESNAAKWARRQTISRLGKSVRQMQSERSRDKPGKSEGQQLALRRSTS
jgi:hypothetical protein